MRVTPKHLARVVPLVLLVLLGSLAGCSGTTSTVLLNADQRDCSAIVAAARQLVLVDPRTTTSDQLDRNEAAVTLLDSAATAASSDAIATPARHLAATAQAYAAALTAKDAERATANESLLQQQAGPLAQACGYAGRADQIFGSTSGSGGGIGGG